jgi:hypothetical protein
MTDEERERIKAETEATLERLKNFGPRRLPPVEDRLEQWRDRHDVRDQERATEREHRQRQERQVKANALEDFWASVDVRIAAALTEQRESLAGVIKEIAHAAGELSEAVDRKLSELERGLNRGREERASHLDKVERAHARRFDDLRGEIDRRLRDAEAAYAQRVMGLEHQLDRANVSLNQQHADKRADERHEATIIELRDLLKRPN